MINGTNEQIRKSKLQYNILNPKTLKIRQKT